MPSSSADVARSTYPGHRVRTWGTALFLVVTSLGFWFASRYPALNDKAAVAGQIDKANPLASLGFSARLEILATDSFLWKVFANTVNWLDTNLYGMSFGIVVAAGILTLLSTLHRRDARTRLGSSVLGAFAGAPLGLCANCAAPVGTAIAGGGVRLETALSTMIASPTLNVIVITMVIALFPPYMVVLKLAATAVVLLVIVPLIGIVAERRGVAARALTTETLSEVCSCPPESIGSSLGWVTRNLARNLWVVLRTAVPLMILAGLAGAVVITILPWDSLADVMPPAGGVSLLVAFVILAVIGVMLPMPVAFDVAMAAVFFAAGMPAPYVMVLLFTLGIFSIYPYTLLGREVSWRVATSLVLALVVIGVGTGASALYIDRREERALRSLLLEELASFTRPTPAVDDGRSVDTLDLADHALSWSPSDLGTEEVVVEEMKLRGARGGLPSGPHFTRFDGRDLGFAEQAPRGVIDRYMIPFAHLGGIASGDVHGDGWDDVLLATTDGLALYANLAGERFERQTLPAPPMTPGAAMLVDVDGDGWLDIVFSAFTEGVFAMRNDGGAFAAPERIYEPDADIAIALGAADLDGDDDIDLVVGNYTAGLAEFAFPESRDVVLRQDDDGFAAEELTGIAGPALTLLLSDLNDDGTPDLFVGNDFSEPDSLYLSQDDVWHPVGPQHGLVPRSGLTTMSLDSADLDNDGQLEVYVGQVSQPTREIGSAELCARLTVDSDVQACERGLRLDHAALRRKGAPSACTALHGRDRLECFAYGLFRKARELNDPTVCEPIADALPRLWRICSYLGRDHARGRTFPDDIPSQNEGNILLVPHQGRYVLAPDELGVTDGGWTWNARFADLDADGLQDLYITNGWPGLGMRESSVLYSNTGEGFVDATGTAGLEEYRDTLGSTYIDLDNDGDLDIITIPTEGAPIVYRNETSGTASIQFELLSGDRPAVGATAVLESDAGSQLRELKASGGYMSFDAPRLHFGLDGQRTADRIGVRWPTGEVTEVDGPFETGKRYRLRLSR